ncbi:biofilm-forming protein [Bacillus salitolerans]|uniref:Biofilm-forming protein n=1 Tax=Bacillus salitolerans TaxID=1437434 RepID=A0ABW4LY37_9BACI
MAKDGIQNSSLEQVRNDHETESAFKFDNPKTNNKGKKNK